jgi:AmmeMemoRadiSam system protein B
MTRPAVRQAAVAGAFYPVDPDELTRAVDTLLDRARLRSPEGTATPAPVALVAPHAGYIYSGPVAATAYECLRDSPVRRIAVLGPAHYVPLKGIAVPASAVFATPIGTALAERHEGVTVDDQPHAPEHSIEVQLPFLQRVLPHRWTCLPLVIGLTAPEEVADVLDTLCADGDILPIISTDLSHYFDQASAQRRDRQTAKAVVGRDVDAIGSQDACGAFALRGLLHWARRHDLRAQLLHLASSADGPGNPDRVVGYGAFALVSSTGPASNI